MSPPYLVTVYTTPVKYETQQINTDKELNKLREIMDRNNVPYTISCTSAEAKTQDNSPLRISGPTEESNGKRTTTIKRIIKSASNVPSAYTKAMEKLFAAWK